MDNQNATDDPVHSLVQAATDVTTNDVLYQRATLPPPLTRAAVESTQQSSDSDSQQNRELLSRQPDRLVELAIKKGCELFVDSNGNTFVTLPVDNHHENWPLNSRSFKRWLLSCWRDDTGHGITSYVVTEALTTLDAIAARERKTTEIFLRVAHFGGCIYVDLCNEGWQSICISPEGWWLVDRPPVKFVRKRGMLPLQMPFHNGNILKLRSLINAPDEKNWCLILSWLLSCFSEGPFPVLVLTGEQGSAKSFLCRVVRQLVDPSEVEVTTAPREARDVIIAAQNSYVLGLDNLSGISVWLSDLLCSISTGSAYRERMYHTNSGEEQLFRAKRPVVLNGIDFGMRADLLSRSLLVNLPVISESNRKDERELIAEIRNSSSEILGGIFDVLSATLKNLPRTNLAEKPRMADFALWISAAEPALGWEDGQFMRVYSGNNGDAVELAIESDSFGSALRDFISKRRSFKGSWRELVNELCQGEPPRGWPETSKAVANRLKRLAPALRHFNISWKHNRDDAHRYYEFWIDASNTSNPTDDGLLR